MRVLTRARRRPLAAAVGAATLVALTACAAPSTQNAAELPDTWDQVLADAEGQTVSLWMWGGDPQGNAYVDDVLTPAAADLGVRLRRVPVADTGDALTRVLSETQAGVEDGEVDLVWVNGDNFATGQQAGAWLCGWTDALPHHELTDPDDPLLTSDFGTDVAGCESPWHKAQFTLVYDSARVADPPHTIEGLLDWARQHPGRFTYPAPPDFTGSVFVRQALYAESGGPQQVPATFSQDAYDELTPPLWAALREVEPALWREGRTYPRDLAALDQLFVDGEVDFTMTYGPATLTDLVAQGTFPETTRVLTLDDGTIGNASFLAIPASSGESAGAVVVADLALSPQQQAAKADPEVWGQFSVLDLDRLEEADRARFEALPDSPVVPPYEELSQGADPELSADWVPALDDGWRATVLADR